MTWKKHGNRTYMYNTHIHETGGGANHVTGSNIGHKNSIKIGSRAVSGMLTCKTMIILHHPLNDSVPYIW